jgi:pyruvate,water dikinase
MTSTTVFAASPVHVPGREKRWTTANVDEGLPGIVTPITWSMYFPPTESTMRDCWVDMGVMPRRLRPIPDDVDGRFLSVAYGHAIANVDNMGQMAARIPGGSAAAMEEQLFGSVQGDGLVEPTGLAKVKRYPLVAAKLPIALRGAIRTHAPLAVETDHWWRRAVFDDPEPTPTRAAALLKQARDHFERVLTPHMVLTMVGQGIVGQVEAVATRAGAPGTGGELVKTDGGTAEFALVRDLWALAAGTISAGGFLRQHGYHGAREGLVDSVVWREDSAAIEEIAAAYRTRDAVDVNVLAARRAADHRAAMARLEAGLGPLGFRFARALVGFAANVPEWRETGRANILKSVDVARFAYRVAGRDLAGRNVLDDPSDAQFLTVDEICGLYDRSVLEDAVPEMVSQRRLEHAQFAEMDLPHVWRGVPTVTSRADLERPEASTTDTIVTGLGVSAGIGEGVVRIVVDLDAVDFWDEDEPTVMVCRATDPSWSSLFPLAEAVVTDVGSQLSHAAIVCRELGLPCVANTRNGTARLRDGMRVRVDGSAGTVTVLAQ